MTPTPTPTREQLNRYLAGRTIQTCNLFELEHFDVDAFEDILLVHDGTKPAGSLPEVYRREGDALRRVEWWRA